MEPEVTETPEAIAPIWAQIEIMGHRTRVGLIEEVQRFGRTMVRITRPALPAIPAYTEECSEYVHAPVWRSVKGVASFPETPATLTEVEYYSPEALFCVKEISEARAMEMLQSARPRPAHTFTPDAAALLEAGKLDNPYDEENE